MSRIYLVRHGQAGTRQAYDSLSELGKQQARLLGEYFGRIGVKFSRAYSGALTRQRQTAEEVMAACSGQGTECPAPEIDAGWNEFDLDHVYKQLAPILCEEDLAFRREFEIMKAELESAGEKHDAQVHRRWTPSDLKIVQAWIQGHPRYHGETWLQFHDRILSRRPALVEASRVADDHNIIVFTSATPIGIWAALGMEVTDHRAMRLAGVLYNSSFSMVRVREGQINLHTFNAVPHLPPDLCTYR